ncbi:MAG: ABC-F family ATP-binding cassette domain-containing protein [Clostridia bacterium]|nr:ABC-F family ATP-binding cassette domain-containing protein [Clostridia bacterium]
MIAININNVSKNYGFGLLFENLSLVINEGDKIALIGQNGTGKSTLLKMIAGKENFNNGSIDIKKNSVIGYLEQQISDTHDSRLCKDILLSAFKDIFEMEERLIKLEKLMTECQDDILLEKLINKYSKEQERFMELGGYDINTKINYILSGLKIEKSFLEKHYDTLSGGEKTLIHFAQILLSNPDILLLDEPTNHLDIKRMEWLEEYLTKYTGTVVIVSHDRYFLDKVVKNVFEIDNKQGKLFKGNYTTFTKEKENLELKVFEQYKNQQKQIASMKEAIKRLKEWGERGDNPTMFRRANAIQKRLNTLEENSIEKPKIQKNLPINFIQSDRSSNECVILQNYSVKFYDKILFDNVDFKFFKKDKVALVGDNGSGKSTLIKSIVGEFKNYTGNIKLGNIKIGYFEQIITFENPKQTVLDFYKQNAQSNEEDSRRTLSKFYFYKDYIYKQVGNLSGGEKIRLKLAVLLKKEVNVLIFDEPTNHIDIMTREVLEDTLQDFKGAVILVSHDRYFINNIATKIVEIKNHNLKSYDGNYDYYKSKCNN